MRSLAFTRLLTLMMVMMVVVGCQPQPAQPTNEVLDLELERLLVDQTLFPLSWYVDIAPQPWYWKYREGAEATGIVQLRQQGSRAIAVHRLYRYQNDAKAAAAYQRLEPSEFFSYSWSRPLIWQSLDELSFQSQTADQFKFGCAVLGKTETDPDRVVLCQALGQYGKYVSTFFTWVALEGASGMSLEDLQPILQAIDQRMSSQTESSR